MNILLDSILTDRILNLSAFESANFLALLVKFVLSFGTNFIIIRYIYYKSTNKKDYLFSYLLISIVVFFLCFMLSSVTLELGFAIGLFAIFGIIRYRTRQIPIKEMTYLFVIIGISVITALESDKISIIEILFANASILLLVWVLERLWLVKYGVSKKIVYEKIENVKPENYHLLMQDLEDRTGLKIKKIEIRGIDFLRDVANITIYYSDPGSHDSNVEIKQDSDDE